ncbi:leucyl/phenylalanyl-tRNA--protein transferase [Nocardiopsis baichengensis]|uniref:leucyl/phenylalanyl-tRNA--protein transferase n=1 Tax=Nocardiopsis baichengensis TaxID=280240 RepID=UPI00034C9AA9|nr:leucyl/phenylalanyl-tRNA--protein transferase [Nocardiopsis baichengensis]
MSRWKELDLSEAPAEGPIAFCADIGPQSIADAQRAGLYPFPAPTEEQALFNEAFFADRVEAGQVRLLGEGDPYTVAWCSPDPRAIVLVDEVRVSRSMRQALRNRLAWTTTADACFARVVRECTAGREPRWITDELAASLERLHVQGRAHSVEVWEDGELVGGVFGSRVGGVFTADSMFHRRAGASKVALFDLAERFAAVGGFAIDMQQEAALGGLIGARTVSRAQYLRLLEERAADTGPPPAEERPARRLAG